MLEYFSRIGERIPVERQLRRRVVIVGVGLVGSYIADQLARCAIGELVLIDGDRMAPENVGRHLCGAESVGLKKADAVARRLVASVPGLQVEYIPEDVTDEVSDLELDRVLAQADVIIAATDRQAAQRRINAAALRLEIPAVYPGLAADGGGEVFVAHGAAGLSPCFLCWSAFRHEETPLRAVQALAVDAFPTVEAAVRLVLAVCEPRSEHALPLLPTRRGRRPPSLFLVSRFGARMRGVFAGGRSMRRVVCDFRPGCPACGGRPDPERQAVRMRQTAVATRETLRRPASTQRRLFAFGLSVSLLVALAFPNSIAWGFGALFACALAFATLLERWLAH